VSECERLSPMPGRLLRGVLIGIAEIIPGVSGGTIALIVGVYQDIISAAAHIVRAFTLLFTSTGRAEISAELRSVRWSVVIPVLIGMFSGIFLGASLLEPLISAYPIESRAVFAGLILASLWVPIRMVASAWNLPMVALAVLAATASFVLTGLRSCRILRPHCGWLHRLRQLPCVLSCCLAFRGLSCW
jgi:putative membrane protein